VVTACHPFVFNFYYRLNAVKFVQPAITKPKRAIYTGTVFFSIGITVNKAKMFFFVAAMNLYFGSNVELHLLAQHPIDFKTTALQAETTGETYWSQFRGTQGSGHYAGTHRLPLHINKKETLAWSAPICEGHSSPIAVGEMIVVTGYKDHELTVTAVQASDGSIAWSRAIKVKELEKVYHHGPASATPVSDGENVFAVFGSFGVISFDSAGNERWRHEFSKLENTFGSAASPILIGDQLIVIISDAKVSRWLALDKTTGELKWEHKRPGAASTWSTPTHVRFGTQDVVLIYEPFHLRAVDVLDGKELWSIPGLADEPIMTPQVSGDTIIVTSYNMKTNQEVIGVPSFEQILRECDRNGDQQLTLEESSTNKSVLSRPDSDGEGDHPLKIFFRMLDENRDGLITKAEWPRLQGWLDEFTHANGFIALQMAGSIESPPSIRWKVAEGVPECPTPLVHDNRLTAVRNGGIVTSIDIANGKVTFKERLLAGGPYYASPVLGMEHIYFASARGVVSVVKSGPKPVLVSSVDLGEAIWATPALVNGTVYVRSKSHLWAFHDKSN
jgi:outer membrane protein assembly factor BamB